MRISVPEKPIRLMKKWLLNTLVWLIALPQVQAEGRDTIIFRRYMQAAQDHLYSNKDSAFYYLDAALLLACEENWTLKAIEAALNKATSAAVHTDLKAVYETLSLVEDELKYFPRDSLDKESFLTLEQLWGYYYKSAGDIGKATRHFNNLIRYLEAQPEKSLSDYNWLNATYQFVADIHKTSGRYDEALECFFHSRSHETARAALKGAAPDYKHHNIHIAKLYRLKEDFPKAHRYYREALQAFEEDYAAYPERRAALKNSMISLYLNLAGLYRDEGRPDSALAMIDRAITYHDKDDPFYDDTYVVQGLTYASSGAFDKAVRTLMRAFRLREGMGRGDKNYEAGLTLSAIGEVCEKQDDYAGALRFYQRALSYLSESFNSPDLSDNPTLHDRIGPQNALLEVLIKKGNALYQAHRRGQAPAQSRDWAWNTALLAIRLIDTIRMDYAFDYDKMNLLSQSYSVYELAIRLAYERGGAYHEKAFELAEKSKAVLLYEAVRSTQAEAFAGIREEGLQRLGRLRAKLVELNNQMAAATEEQQVEALRSERYTVVQRYQELLAFFQSEYPDYYRLKYGMSGVSVQVVQEKLLRPGQALAEFFVGNEDAYAFLITEDCGSLQMKKLDWSDEAREAALSIRDDIYAMRNEAYIRKGRLLYDVLLRPVLGPCPVKNLVIIPDGLLGYVPFDALLTDDIPSGKRTNYRSFPYLVSETTISQCFSATMLYEMNYSPLKPAGKRLALYAPAYRRAGAGPVALRQGRSLLDTLLYNEVEARGIRRLVGGALVCNRDAVKAHFTEHAAGYKALHISAHAKVNDQAPNYSFIAFSNVGDTLGHPYKLYVHELYNMRLPVAMAVLSACETGVGQSRRGEGIISIARAFSYAGAQSIVTTLWNIDDKQSKELMLYFYRNLGKGQRKDDALNAAKRSYLAEAPDQERAHPLYWASFVAIGNMDALELERLPGWGAWVFWLALAALAAIVGLMALRRRA